MKYTLKDASPRGYSARAPVWLALFILFGLAGAWAENGSFKVGQAAVRATPEMMSSNPTDKLFFDFKNMPLSEAADFVVTRAGLTGVALEPGTETMRVTAAQYGVSPEQSLRKIARSVGCGIERVDATTFRIVRQKRVTLSYVDVDIRTVIKQVTKLADASVTIHDEVRGKVNLQLTDVPWRDALDNVVRTAGNFVVVEEACGILRILPITALFDQRETRVFPLSYIQPPDPYEPLIESRYADRATTGGRRKMTFSARGPLFEKTNRRGAGPDEAKQTLDELKRRQRIRGTTFTLFNALINIISPVGRFEYDVFTNSVIVSDIPSKLREVADVIRLLDIEPVQVFFDVKFVATGNDDNFDFGVNFIGVGADQGFTISHNGGRFNTILPFARGSGGVDEWVGVVEMGPPTVRYDAITGLPSPATADANFTNGGWVFGTLDFSQFATLLRVLKTDSESSIMQAPKIYTLDNHEATIFVGQTVRFAETFSQSNVSGGVETGIREAENSPIETGFQLFIEPHVVKGTDNVILTIIPQDKTLTGTTSAIPGFNQFGAGNNIIQLPQVDTRALVTKVMVRSGQTLVLGGLIDERESETVRKIPVFGDIPILGYFFRFRSKSLNRNNLVIFMTVMIVPRSEAAEQIYTVHKEHEAQYLSDTENVFLKESFPIEPEESETGLPGEE